MAEVIEGRNAVVEALRAGVRLSRVLIADGTRPHPSIDEIRARAAETGTPVEQRRKDDLARYSARGAHQGVVALVEPFAYAEIGGVIAGVSGRPRALVVILDHVTDPGNLGAVIRSVEVAGGSAVVVPKDRSATVGPVAHKTSAGATAHLPVVRVTNIGQALDALKAADFWVAGADERASDDLWHAPLDGRLALVLGAEGSGLGRLTRERCDFLVSVPVAGRVSSLNVAQAASVLAFEWVRRGQ
ncbi:MAG: 23S rRNA (guanosine(2251)-2'-O)-methyltransferase RlmB [Aeromicrobium sp.]|jgi:23S rRNA (guanosine2251-2'-O)-methyltransferase|nr:23S rRNA (guanosine(2251)-2'-O)-methyltransferase RlmB [Aeromicrobium sp.]